jgi:hypothetical protein
MDISAGNRVSYTVKLKLPLTFTWRLGLSLYEPIQVCDASVGRSFT